MKSVWKQTAPDQIEIKANAQPILIVFGLPFLAIGLWFGSHAFGAAWDVVTRKVTLMDDIFGLTLLPILAAAFLWPGVLLVLGRKRWVINTTSRQILETTRMLMMQRSKTYALDDFKQVRVYQGKEDSRNVSELPSEEDHRRYTVPQPYCVDLVARDNKGRSQTIAAATDAADALEVGKAVAELTQLPLVDQVDRNPPKPVVRIDV